MNRICKTSILAVLLAAVLLGSPVITFAEGRPKPIRPVAADGLGSALPASSRDIQKAPAAPGATLNVPGDYATIQAAIAAAVSGDIINVAAGTFTTPGQVYIDKDITLTGAGSGLTTISPTFNTGSDGDSRGWFLVETGFDFDLSGVTLDATGWNVHQGIRNKGEGSCTDVAFNEIKYPGYQGMAVAAFGTGPMDVTDCTFTQIGRIGVIFYGPGGNVSTFTGNTYTGKGPGDWLDYGVELGGGAIATVHDNYISGCRGVALSDGSTSAGILATTYFAPGTGGTITNNVITDNSAGMVVGYDASDASVVEAHNNAIYGNDEGVVSTAPVVDVSGNWWGSNDPTTVNALANGGTLVDYTPWLDTGTNNSAGIGFDGDFSALHVSAASPQTGIVGRAQEGIDLVDGSTVYLHDGTYEEQLEIGKDLVLQGDGAGTEILSPTSLTLSWATTSYNYYAVVYIHDTANVVIRDLTLNGAGRGNANYRFVGAGFRNAGGGVYDCDILDVRDTPFSGAQHGVGVQVWNDDLTLRSIDVHDCVFTGFQKNAMTLNTDATTGLTVDVRRNTITGAGATDVTAQNGIQVWSYNIATGTVTGTVADNVIHGIAYDNTAAATKWVATSILNIYADLDITGNTITGSHMGIYNIDGSGTIQGNDLTIEKVGVYAFGIIGSDPPKAVPSPMEIDELPVGSSRPVIGAPLAVLDVDILDNVVTFSGSDNTATYGIEVDAGWGPNDLDATINHNTVCGFEVGIEIWACQSDCDTGVFTSVTANYNYIGCGNTWGMRSNADYILTDGTNNWWGAASGPYHATLNPTGTGDDVSDYVDFDPWMGAENVVSVLPVYGTTNCTDPITYTFWFDHVGVDEVRGIDVTFQVDGAVVNVGTVSTDIVEGSYLGGFGTTTFYQQDNTGGEYKVTTSILGGSTGATGSGDLFTVEFTPVAEGLSAITITDIKVRDVDNVPLDAAMVDGEVRIDCTLPTMEPIVETEDLCYNIAPTFANFGFDDDQALDWAEYQIDADGEVTIFTGINLPEWNDDGWTLPGFTGLSEGIHTVYFYVADMAGNENGVAYSWSFIKDTVAPAAPTDFSAMPGHNKVHLAWTNPTGDASFVGVEIRLVAWGEYPQYLTEPSYPADHLGGTFVTQEPGESFTDDPRAPRDIYYYAAFSYDCAGNYSAYDVGAKDRATSYWLGDIGGYDGEVNFGDLGPFSNAFGAVEGGGGWNEEADFGPSDDWSRFGIPLPDDVIDFEDLMIFSMNYGNVDPASFDFVPEEKSVENLENMVAFELVPTTTEAGTIVSIVMNSRASTLKGARLLIETGDGCEIVTVTKGDAIAKRGDIFFGTIPSFSGIEICVAALGVDKPIAGSGEVAKILVKSGGSINVSLAEAEIRDTENRQFVLEGTGSYEGPAIPIADALNQNFPNPFNPATTVAFDLAKPATVRIGIYDVSGRLVRTLVNRSMEAGSHEVGWNGTNNIGTSVPSGLYFYRMTTSDGFTATRKMILLR